MSYVLSISDWLKMPDIDLEWARNQLQKIRAVDTTQYAVLELLTTLNNVSPNGVDQDEVLDIFSKLARGHSLIPDDTEGTWAEVIPGAVRVGDTVRVKANAYTGELGQMHNGRSGVIIAIRYGDILVRYTDGGSVPALDPRFPPQSLEKRWA